MTARLRRAPGRNRRPRDRRSVVDHGDDCVSFSHSILTFFLFFFFFFFLSTQVTSGANDNEDNGDDDSDDGAASGLRRSPRKHKGSTKR